jgi:hypothetical protein
MMELLSGFSPNNLLGLVSIVGSLLCGVLVIGAYYYWHRIRKADIAAKLKHDMLDRGMSAEEIRVVLEAGSK